MVDVLYPRLFLKTEGHLSATFTPTSIIELPLLAQACCFACSPGLHSFPASRSAQYSAAAAVVAAEQVVVVSQSSADSDSLLSALYFDPSAQLAQLHFGHRSQLLQNLRRLSKVEKTGMKNKAHSEVVAVAGGSIAVGDCLGRDSCKVSVAEVCHMEAASGGKRSAVGRRARCMPLVVRAAVRTAAAILGPAVVPAALDTDCNHSVLAVGIAAECLSDYTGHRAANTAVCNQDAVRKEVLVGENQRN